MKTCPRTKMGPSRSTFAPRHIWRLCQIVLVHYSAWCEGRGWAMWLILYWHGNGLVHGLGMSYVQLDDDKKPPIRLACRAFSYLRRVFPLVTIHTPRPRPAFAQELRLSRAPWLESQTRQIAGAGCAPMACRQHADGSKRQLMVKSRANGSQPHVDVPKPQKKPNLSSIIPPSQAHGQWSQLIP